MTRPGRLWLIALLLVSGCSFLRGDWPGVSPQPPVVTPPAIETPAPTPPPVVLPGRSGPVRLSGRAFVDDEGPFLGVGTSLFWALWGERHDPARLDRDNLAVLAGKVDYVRIFGMVGAPSWSDRVIDPTAPDYWAVVDRLDARLARHGLRFQITVFADAQAVLPDPAARRVFLDGWIRWVNDHPTRVTMLEIANEYWQNGLDRDELVALATHAAAHTDVLVGPSATACGSYPEDEDTADQRACVAEWRALHADGRVDVALPHFDRDISKADGRDRPVRQPWEMLWGPRALGLRSYINNEPIGPQSSVADDDDPGRLTMAAAVTWLTGGAAYTLHTGAGIRGGGQADLDRGRSANLADVPHLAETLARLAAARAVLPVQLPNCLALNTNANFPDRLFDVDPDTLTRAYHARCGDTFVALPHGIRGATATLHVRVPITLNGRLLNAGDTVTVPAPSQILTGGIR